MIRERNPRYTALYFAAVLAALFFGVTIAYVDYMFR